MATVKLLQLLILSITALSIDAYGHVGTRRVIVNRPVQRRKWISLPAGGNAVNTGGGTSRWSRPGWTLTDLVGSIQGNGAPGGNGGTINGRRVVIHRGGGGYTGGGGRINKWSGGGATSGGATGGGATGGGATGGGATGGGATGGGATGGGATGGGGRGWAVIRGRNGRLIRVGNGGVRQIRIVGRGGGVQRTPWLPGSPPFRQTQVFRKVGGYS